MHRGVYSNTEKVFDAWNREAKAHQEMTKLRHRNIIKFFAAISRGSERYLMLKWADGGNLMDFWRDNEPRLTTTLVKDVIHQLYGLADALEKIHQMNYRHGDIKPENILRMRTEMKQPGSSELDVGILKICDMTLAKYHGTASQFRSAETE